MMKGYGKQVLSDASSVTHKALDSTKGVVKKAAKGTFGAVHIVESAAKSTSHILFAPIGSVFKKKKPKRHSQIPLIRESICIQETEVPTDFPPVAPDETLSQMDVILRRRITGVSVQEFFDLIWNEGDDSPDQAEGPFYKSWLAASGKEDIHVSNWELAEGGAGSSSPFAFKGAWKKDTTQYGKKRTVDFTFTRTTHLYTGPPQAKVKQLHFAKIFGEERSILHMQIEMEGIPFCDCFNVQIRWVATRIGGTVQQPILDISVGLFVNFVKQTIVAGKIRSGTSEETSKAQKSLMHEAVQKCIEYMVANGGEEAAALLVMEEVEAEEEEDLANEVDGAFVCFGGSFHRLLGEMLHQNKSPPKEEDVVSKKAKKVQAKLQAIMAEWEEHSLGVGDPEVVAKVDSELTDIHAALGEIEKYLADQRLQSISAEIAAGRF